ncbi:hypothetical protein H8356DRAFT_1628065 [Neocallimastix lanati (nom. inval.)]|nr:hypothetical protein H8356DRAFT_1628065 [Neocallimastix sp. JGI-2020a]
MDDNNILKKNTINYNLFERCIYPFFNALPQDVPVDWMIPFLVIIEDFQFIQYIFSGFVFAKLRPWILNIFTIFNPQIINSVSFFFPISVVYVCTIYILIVIGYILYYKGRKILSKRNLWFYNTLYFLVMRYFLSLVFNILTSSVYACRKSDIMGVPDCSSNITLIFRLIALSFTVLIVAVTCLYSRLYFNTNCLSHGKFFGSINSANIIEITIVKAFLAYQKNTLPQLFMDNNFDRNIIRYVIIIIGIVLFLYLSILQLKTQPYYSKVVNNYKFSVYFGNFGIEVYSFFITLLNLNDSQFISDFMPFLFIFLSIFGCFFNQFYLKKTLKRIYVKYQEKQIVRNIRKTTSIDELKNSPEKLKNNKIFTSIERITKETYIKKEIKVFNSISECEIACRFLRTNRDFEAYLLMKKLFEEGINQYTHDADIYITAWFYMYSMKIFYKKNNLLQKYDIELFNGNYMLNTAMELKLNMRQRYLINRAVDYIEIEKKENAKSITSNEVSSSLKLEELKLSAVGAHINGLKEIKELFVKLRNSTNNKDVLSYLANIRRISFYRNSANSQYKTITRHFTDAKDVIKVYILFLLDVMNDDEAANRYIQNIGNVKLNDKNFLNNSNNEMEAQEINININTEKKSDVEKKSGNFKNNSNLNNSFSNSLISLTQSENISVSSGISKDIRKKITLKRLMARKFIHPIKQYKNYVNILIALFIIIFSIEIIYVLYVYQFAENNIFDINLNINIPGTIMEAAGNIRLLALSLIIGDIPTYQIYKEAADGDLYILQDLNFINVDKNMRNTISDSPLFVPVGEYAFDTVEVIPIADSFKKLVTNLKYVVNREMLRKNETYEDILYEPHFRYFIVNSKSNFENAFKASKNVLGNMVLQKFKIMEIIGFSLEILLSIITIIMIYICFVSLKRTINKTSFNIFKMFKYLSKDNFEDIITNYEEKIETLCENFEIDKDITNNSLRNKNKKRIIDKVLIFSFIIIFIIIVAFFVPVYNSIKEISDLLKIVDKSSDRFALIKGIQLYTYEVIYQDRSIFVENEPQRILNDYINRIKTIQNELKSGSYGGPTFNKYPSLDFITKENGCHRMYYDPSCNFMFYDISYGFTEEAATLPLDQLISEYLYHLENFIIDANNGEFIQLPFTSKENIEILFRQVLNDKFFRLQEKLINNIVGDFLVLHDNLTSYSNIILNNQIELIIYLVIFGILALLIIDIFVLNRIFNDSIKEMESIVSFVFLIPQKIINKNEKFRSFLETTQTDE